MLDFLDNMKSMFSHYGFTDTPLSDDEIVQCYEKGLWHDETYAVGCDVSSGFSFEESLKENTKSL